MTVVCQLNCCYIVPDQLSCLTAIANLKTVLRELSVDFAGS